MKNLFQDQPPHEREELLKGMVDKTDLQSVRRHYNEEEKSQMKDHLTKETIEMLDSQDEFKEIKKTFNKAIDAHKKQIVMASKDLKRGYSENTETVYGVADHERDMMDFYDSRGEYLNSRRLLPDERQTTMLSMNTGTHNG